MGLSPMDGVTDGPFRYMVAKYGVGVDLLFTEFVNVDALYHTKRTERRERVMRPLISVRELSAKSGSVFDGGFYEIAQIFGKKPELFAEAAELIESLGFDGIDINMGCPAKKVSEHGSGAGLIRTPELAQEILRVTKEATKLPVSVKTRVGVESVGEMEEWIEAIMEAEPVSLSLHGRTLRQMYTGKSDWEAIRRAGEIVHRRAGIILGNGDVGTLEDAEVRMREYGVDGVLIGRATFGNPGIFAGMDPDESQRRGWMMEHARLHEQVYGKGNFLPARKHLAWYAKGFPGASELRSKLVRCSSPAEVGEVLAKC